MILSASSLKRFVIIFIDKIFSKYLLIYNKKVFWMGQFVTKSESNRLNLKNTLKVILDNLLWLLFYKALPYPMLEKAVLMPSFHTLHSLKTIYQTSVHMVNLSRLMDWHSMEFLFEFGKDLFLKSSRHSYHQV